MRTKENLKFNNYLSRCVYTFDVIASIKSMESMEYMYEKVSRNVTFSGIHRNTQIIVMTMEMYLGREIINTDMNKKNTN